MSITDIDDDIYIKLFSIVKNNKWDEVINFLEKNKDIDINTKDRNNNYIISYAVINNRLDIIKILIKREARIDILDSDDRTILYYPIKYGYNDILNYLLLVNKDLIGVNIINIRDKNFKTPLHYAISNKNIYALNLLLDNDANPNYVDNRGYNLLHHAIFTRDINICKIIIPHIANINMTTLTGDSALHYACNLQLIDIAKMLINAKININIQDHQHEFTALHYAVNLNLIEIVEYLLDNNANPNTQDIFGNTVIHYAILEKYYTLIDIIFNKSKHLINVNLYNIDGKIPLHILLENYASNSNDEILLNKLLPLSNLSIINNDGNSCLLLLCALDLWKKYKNELLIKRLDIFTKNKKNKSVLDIINKKDYDEFINLVAESYFSRLKSNKDNWKEEWQNICSREFIDKDNDKFKSVFNKSIKNQENLSKECVGIIKTNILKNIEDINSGTKKCGIASYPIAKNKICINIEEGEILNVCTFTGTTLDILLGLIYLLKTHKNACAPLSTDFYDNENLYNFYKSVGIMMGSRGEFLNFEIIWISQKLYLVENFYEKIKDCIEKKVEFIIIPLGIELSNGSHANYIIYDVKNKTVERFEPHGASTPPGLNYSPKILDELLESRFKLIDEDIKYYAPQDYLPKIGFQLMDIFENNKKKIGDPGGFCALWSIWYVDMRLKYKDIDCRELVKILIRSIKNQNVSVKNMIRNYAKNIIDIRDDILTKVNMDINDWLNDVYTDVQINGIIQQIQNMISNL
jgi:ankyrin repeat protein